LFLGVSLKTRRGRQKRQPLESKKVPQARKGITLLETKESVQTGGGVFVVEINKRERKERNLKKRD